MSWHRVASSVLAWLVLGACQSPPPAPTPSVGSNTNWLQPCDEDAECGSAGACRCGVCSRECTQDEQCGTDGAARCARRSEDAIRTGCELAAESAGVCLARCEPGACADGFSCLSNTCLPQQLPAAEICEPVRSRSPADRAREEALLALLLTRRTSGELRCDQAEAPAAEAPLHLDPRLTCAARVLADDMQARKTPSLIDAEGRDSTRRMQLAGYAPRLWGESFAVYGQSIEDSLSLMLRDVDSCLRLQDRRYRDIGVGSAGEVMIVTIGAE